MKDGEAVVAKNPCVRFHNNRRGYVSCEITRKTMRSDYRVLDYVTREGAPLRTAATFTIDDGKPGAVRV
jgi:alkaline phosphatase D